MQPLSLETRTLITFLNSLVIGGGVAEWSDRFCKELMKLLGDVDNVSFRVMFSADLRAPKAEQEQLLITMAHSEEEEGTLEFTLDIREEETPPHHDLIDSHLQENPRLRRKVEFYGYDYFYENGEYLGSIILWRARHRRELSPRTLELMRALEPFFVFLFSDVVTRYSYFQPAGASFGDVVEQIVHEAKLTPREQEALILHLYGIPYEAIAEKLHITLAAVKKRIIQIHRKVGVTSQAELFARYFAAMVLPPTDDGDGCEPR